MKSRTGIKSMVCGIFLATVVSAGGPEVVEGSVDVLKGQQLFNVQCVWDNDFEYDGDPFSETYAEDVADLKEEGKTAEIKALELDWKRWKDTTYAESFAKGIGNFFEDEDNAAVKGITGGIYHPEAKYTLIVKTIELDRGGMKTAFVVTEVTVVETANPQKTIAKISDIVGVGRIPYASEEVRVKDAYFRAGDVFADDCLNELLYEE